jgi:molybdopterin molybdotransferase
MLNYKEAQQLITAQARSFGKEKISLDQSFGRILSETIYADRDYPPFNRSTMDGYAIAFSDFQKGIRQFEIAETIYAGQSSTRDISSAQCFKIMTGAPVPEKTDMVIRREDTQESEHTVTILTGDYRQFQNIAIRGEDFKQGVQVISAHTICTPPIISVLAATGHHTVTVERLPNIAVLTTGNEVVPVTDVVSPIQIRNSNAWLLKALLEKQHIQPALMQHVTDDKDNLRKAFAQAMEADIIISCGGVSAGDADYVPGIAEEMAIKILFHKLAIKPGKPILCGVTPSGGMLFGLPGNPFSCLVTFTLFIQRYLDACNGLTIRQPHSIPLQGERMKKSTLDEFFPVQTIRESNTIAPLTFNGSGDIQAALHADGLGIHPAAFYRLNNGDHVEFISL